MTVEVPTDHRDLEIITPQDCDRRLAATPVGRIAFPSKGGILVLPVTYLYHEQTIVFRTSHGEKLAAAERGAEVGFEIDTWDAINHTGWSVVVQGSMERVYDADEIKELDGLGLIPWAREKFASHWVRLRPAYITGRRLR